MWRLLAIAALALGCGGRASDPQRFVPAPSVARTALAAALDAWKQGKPTGAVAGTSPAVQVVDEMRVPKQRLIGYDILGEIPGGGPRTFTVSLRLEEPVERKTTRYVVVGIEPLWVFRQEDFDKMAHWEMNMNHGADEEKPDVN